MEQEKNFVCVDENVYMELIRESERFRMIKSAFLSCVKNTTYGVTFNDNYMLSVLASSCQDEYDKWYNSQTEVDD
jgi:hypothetical protein